VTALDEHFKTLSNSFAVSDLKGAADTRNFGNGFFPG
jgi:hypothetical protein